ncbi:MAG: MATE family efflux transporter [Oscillospiraceae bacterium]|nr:MATE family efflux transporter [Oscillospiraceae bacterium]
MVASTEPTMIQGSVPRQLARFAWPLVLTNFLQTLFGLTDVLIVGRFIGRDAMSAVTIGGQSTLFLLTFSLGLAAGGQILIAQFKGAGKQEDQGKAAGALFVLSLIVGVLVALFGFFLAPLVIRLLQAPEEALEGAKQYMRITSLGLVFAFIYNAVAGVLRGLGDSRRPLLFAAVAAVIHLGLGFLFLGTLSMGVWGAALATVVAQAIAALFGGAYLFMRRREIVICRPDWVTLLQVLKVGVPFGLQMGLLNLSNLFIIRLVNPYGVAASAALGAGSRVTNVLLVPMMAIGNAASTVVGQNLGAGEQKRAAAAVRWALVYTLSFVAVTATFTFAFPARLIGLFTDDPDVLQVGVQYIMILVWGYLAYALYSGFNAAILGAGLTLYSLSAVGAEALLGRVALTWIFSNLWGLPGVFTAQAIAPYLAAILSIIYYALVPWRNAGLVDKFSS